VTSGDQERKQRPGPLAPWIIGVPLLLAGFVWLWWHWIPVLYEGYNGVTQAERLTAITNTRTGLLAGLIGVGALGTLWLNIRSQRLTAESLRFTAETVRLSEENVRLSEENLNQTKHNQEETFRLAERGHLTDRYAKAIEQLGNDKLDIRLGGIYALEQIARDSELDRDQATIVEVLSAFVRNHSERGRPLPPQVDVQAALTVLGRLPERPGVNRGDFAGAWLHEINLRNCNFRKAQFERANLSDANLSKADFSGAFLSDADLTDAYLRGTNFTSAVLDNAYLLNADVKDAQFDRAILLSASLENAHDLTRDQIANARINASTVLPDHLRRLGPDKVGGEGNSS
jgi:uncharacterized protein YjbI with pentapeptide repeats